MTEHTVMGSEWVDMGGLVACLCLGKDIVEGLGYSCLFLTLLYPHKILTRVNEKVSLNPDLLCARYEHSFVRLLPPLFP